MHDADEEIPLSRGVTLAVPAARTGVTLSAANYALYKALRRGEAPSAGALADAFIARCRANGGSPVIDGKEMQDDVEARAAVTRDYEVKLERLVPVGAYTAWSKVSRRVHFRVTAKRFG